ncbi:copper amine oxidase N-terminal domain-containing protein [Syntrophothermus sp.]|uniref:copper amine oxidase N-terminal domain-containing protein n=1 Tax=Syntrophothermus sp. TaxID=2736299 RepID=UPI00257D94EA|nr:copper amine oxidase N-terminal domain-containing protein [Syntrophothermus sp.]
MKFVVGSRSYSIGERTFEMDAAPFIENGRTFVPVRFLAYAIGVPENGVSWDGAGQTVRLENRGVAVTLRVRERVLRRNGSPVQMDVAPVLRSNRVFLPARYVAEAFGRGVGWDQWSKSVYVYPVKVDWEATKSGSLQPPEGAKDPPDNWGFEPRALYVVCRVGSRYAEVHAYTPEMRELDEKIEEKAKEIFWKKYNPWFWSEGPGAQGDGLGPEDDCPTAYRPAGKRFMEWYAKNRDPEFDALLARRERLKEESVCTLDLGTPCVAALTRSMFEEVRKRYPALYNASSCLVVPDGAIMGKKYWLAFYAPVIPVAEALGFHF